MTLLDVRGLTVSIAGRTVVDGVDLHLEPGERLGVIGESGSGKSMTCLALLGLLPAGAEAAGSVRFEGEELLGAEDGRLRSVRGRRMSCVFQEPLSALDPLLPVHRHLTAGLRAHGLVSRSDARQVAVRLAESVGLPDAATLVRRYPHELSGGQRQRVMIAMAMSTAPALLLADEPTTALDVTVQTRVLRLIDELVGSHGTALVLVTHDMAVAVNTCDRIAVMLRGRVVEEGSPQELIGSPRHPYTARLVRAAYATTWQPAGSARSEVVPA